jgi:hypothetical protein
VLSIAINVPATGRQKPGRGGSEYAWANAQRLQAALAIAQRLAAEFDLPVVNLRL